ncbi:MAG: HAD family phosphatase [Phycisphaeraceae bacterium]|nr:HAD family phosphatase [Phycisphaeraceae bacterium]
MSDRNDPTLRPLPADPPLLVAIDMDGTLLRSDDTLSQATITAVQQVTELGVKVVLATARPPRSVAAIERQLGLDTLQINHNGALIYDPRAGRPLYHHPLNASLARQLIAVARKIDPSLAVGIDVVDQFHSDGNAAAALRREPCVGYQDQPLGSLDKVLQSPVTKVLFLGQPDSLGRLQMLLADKSAAKVTMAFTHQHLLQIMAAGVDKAAALAKVAEHYGIARDRVMAIGDAPNDVPMLLWAGLAVAMGNAWDDARRAAHFVAPDNNADGVAAALRRHVLEPMEK